MGRETLRQNEICDSERSRAVQMLTKLMKHFHRKNLKARGNKFRTVKDVYPVAAASMAVGSSAYPTVKKHQISVMLLHLNQHSTVTIRMETEKHKNGPAPQTQRACSCLPTAGEF